MADSQRVAKPTKSVVKRLLFERLSLRAICPVAGISLTWFLQLIAAVYDQLPADLCVRPTTPARRLHLLRFETAVDQLWSACRPRGH